MPSMHQPSQNSSASRTRRPAAGLVQAAGRALGLHRRRKGSAIVIVLGVLAVVSLFAAAYLAIGSSDRASTSSLVQSDAVRRQERAVADYIAQIIADDRLSVFAPGRPLFDYVVPTGASSQPLPNSIYRETNDFPWTDFQRTSVPRVLFPQNQLPVLEQRDRATFSPAGSLLRTWNPASNHGVLTFSESDPFLAASAPVWLNADPFVNDPPGLSESQVLASSRDWAHISNISPDGRFVNLFYLRNNFDAPSLDLTRDPNDTNPETATRLTLVDPTTGSSFNVGQDQSLDTPVVPPEGGSITNGLWYVPAHWDSRQVLAFRPAVDPVHGPDQPEHLLYQWVDTDGDGMVDARWQELVDASASTGPTGSVTPVETRALDLGNGHRWFVASRVVDLSSKINVNAATELRQPPTNTDKLGRTPADIDLLRTLQLEHTLSLPAAVQGYQGLSNIGASATGEDDYSAYDLTVAISAGEAGFFALLNSSRDSIIEPGGWPTEPAPLNANFRRDEYLFRGSAFPGSALSLPSAGQSKLPATFGLDCLAELMTYHGHNDPAVLSRLEAAIGTRDMGSDGLPAWNFGPLRSNRPLGVERSWFFLTTPGGGLDQNSGQAKPWPIPANPSAANLAATPMLWNFVDIRKHLTTHSGAAPLRPTALRLAPNEQQPSRASMARAIESFEAFADATPGPSASSLGRETRLPFSRVMRTDSSGVIQGADVHKLFDAYTEALVPFADEAATWDIVNNQPARTLSFGNDPYFALQTAARMAVNMQAMAATTPAGTGYGEGQPEAYTVALQSNITPTPGTPEFRYWDEPTSPGTSSGLPRRLVLDEIRAGVLPSAATTLADPAVVPPGQPQLATIFGVDAQPVLTQVTCFAVYHDTPASKGGDDEFDDAQQSGPAGGSEVDAFPTIDGDINDSTNDDVVMQVLAFQLANPFDAPVTIVALDALADPPVAVPQFAVEFGGRRYDLVDDDALSSAPAPIELDPGESVVFYVLNESKTAINARFSKLRAFAGSGSDSVDAWVKGQLEGELLPPTATNRNDRAYRMRSPVPTIDERIDLLAGTPRVWNPANGEARLWRKMWTEQEKQQKQLNPGGGDERNWMLADRLRDPAYITGQGAPAVDRRLKTSNTNIVQGPPITNTNQGVDAGLTITLWGSLRRPDNPAGPRPIGALPAWVMETEDQAADPPGSLNIADNSKTSPATLRASDFLLLPGTPGGELGKEGSNTMEMWLARDTFPNPGQYELNPPGDYALHPDDRLNPKPIKSSPRLGVPLTELWAEAHVDALAKGVSPKQTNVSQLRPADALMPMGIGPATYFTLGGETQPLHVTLGEALAGTLGYNDAQPVQLLTALDRGQLRTGGFDAADPTLPSLSFVPFVDNDLDGRFDPATGDQPRGVAIPMAARIVDMFTSQPPERATLTAITPGLVNVNTAPLMVLRTLPGLSPTRFDGTSATPDNWWWPTSPDAHGPSSDIGAAIFGYANKAQVATRPLSDTVPNPQGAVAFAAPALGNPATALHPDDTNGRSAVAPVGFFTQAQPTGVDGLRQQPGILTKAEILAIRDITASGGSVPLHDADRLAYDGTTSQLPAGIESVRNYGTTNNGDDDIANDYDEHVALANAVLETTTERSDLFAVWFVLHGYQRSDVENLRDATQSRPGDPLRPSVARRFLMVVDRSNVIRLGQQPKVLMLKELPL